MIVEHQLFSIDFFNELIDEIEDFLLAREMYESLRLLKEISPTLREEYQKILKLKTIKEHELGIR